MKMKTGEIGGKIMIAEKPGGTPLTVLVTALSFTNLLDVLYPE
jgi:hypothetical protein